MMKMMQIPTVLATLLLAMGSVFAQQQPVPLPPVEPERPSSESPSRPNELRVLDPPNGADSQSARPYFETLPPGTPVMTGPMPPPPPSLEPCQRQAMTIQELESIALANNPALGRAAAAVRAARGRWLQVGLVPNPNIGYSASEVGNDGHSGQQGGYVEQDFIRGGKLRLSRNVASQEIRQAEQQYTAEQFRVTNDVRIGFYEVLVLQRKLELVRQLLAVGQQGFAASDKLFKAQETSRVDVLQSRIEVNQARILEQNTINGYSAAWRRLAAVLGAPGMAPMTLTGDLDADLPVITWENALGQLITGSPELGAARAAVSRAQWAVDRARAEPIPNLNVQATAQHDNNSHYDIAGIQATFPLPLFNRNQGGIMQAQAEVSQSLLQLRQLELSLQQRLAATYERYANARQQVERFTKEILPDAKTSLDLVTQGYKQGEFNYLTLLTAQRTFFQTNLSYLDALRSLRESTVELEGLLLRDSLQSQVSTPQETAPATPNINSLVTPPPY